MIKPACIASLLFTAALLTAAACRDSLDEYMTHCHAMGGHTVTAWVSSGPTALICVNEVGAVLEP